MILSSHTSSARLAKTHATSISTLLEASPASFFRYGPPRQGHGIGAWSAPGTLENKERHNGAVMPLFITKSPSEQSACPHIARILRLFWIWKFTDISIFMDYWMDFWCNFTAHPDFIMWYCPVGSFPSLKKESPIFRNRSKNFGRFQIG